VTNIQQKYINLYGYNILLSYSITLSFIIIFSKHDKEPLSCCPNLIVLFSIIFNIFNILWLFYGTFRTLVVIVVAHNLR